MPIYLEVKNGKYAASTVAIEEGDVCRIGRGVRAEVFLPDDPALAETHFMVVFDGFSGRVIDSGSESGTFLNGEKVIAEEFDERCRISAGATEFVVLFEDDFAENGLDTPIKRLVTFLREQDGALFCVLDAARDDKILSLLSGSNTKYMSLYQGESQKQLGNVAPYLIEFDKNRGFLEKLLRNGWGKRWCTFFSSKADFADLRKHLRRFLFAKDEQGETVYFRFYDPSILRTFLPASNGDELRDVFGPITSFAVENEDPSALLIFGTENGKLIRESFSLV